VGQLLNLGVTLANLVTETLKHPSSALRNLLEAAQSAGQTLKDAVNAGLMQPLKDAQKKVLDTLKALGSSALDILKAAAEISLSALATAFTLILEWLGDYRPLDASERTALGTIFGKSIDLDTVNIAVLSPPVDLIEWVNDQRAFTTMRLINFASWKEVDKPTLVHESTHIWQNLQVGPLYMIEALEAQESKEGYNYGFDDSKQGKRRGDGADTSLDNAGGNFNSFNREQQAEIIQHYYVRRYVDNLDPKQYEAWVPYAQKVYS
jgi:hypothetical protein